MATFRLINNTSSVLPLSDSATIAPSGTRLVGQITLEMRRLEQRQLLTIIKIEGSEPPDDPLLPDYVGTADPNAGSGGNGNGNGNGGGGNDLASLTPAPDGSIPEWSNSNNLWSATVAPRNLVLDGGNF